jgi:DNA-binding MarR family transcriptional regulator
LDNDLKDRLIYVLHRFKKAEINFPPEIDMRMSELFVLKGIAEKTSGSDIRNGLCITKPAVSQLLNSLEKKEYIKRETEKSDRRKINVTLTPRGHEVLKEAIKFADSVLEMTISRFGEENTKQLIYLLTLLADISDEINNKNKPQAINNTRNEDARFD